MGDTEIMECKPLKRYDNVYNFDFIIKYFSWLIISILILLAIFTEESKIALIFAMMLVLSASFLSNQDILCMWLFLFPFTSLFISRLYISYFIIKYCFLIVLALRYFLKIVTKEKKIDFKVLIPLFLYVVYTWCPFLGRVTSLKKLSGTIYNIAIAFLVYDDKENLDFTHIAMSFVFAMIVSSIFSFFVQYIQAWSNIPGASGSLDRDTIPKFKGFFEHSNIFMCMDVFALSILVYELFNKEIKVKYFSICLILLLAFGYLTFSRNFVLSVMILCICVFALALTKVKKEYLKYILPACGLTLVLLLVIFRFSNLYNIKFKDHYENSWKDYNKNITPEEWELIYAGKLHYDTGRIGLYYVYFQFFKNNILRLFVGRGNGFPYIGETHPHNFILDTIYTNGLLGLCIYIVFLFFIFDIKNIKKYLKNKNYSAFLIVIAYLSTQLINTYFSFIWLMLIILCFYDANRKTRLKNNNCFKMN